LIAKGLKRVQTNRFTEIKNCHRRSASAGT
jgi:hypothetical protein